MFEDVGKAIGCIVVFVIILCISCIGVILHSIILTPTQTYESKVIVKPDYRLESKGKTIDTIYIYKFKNK